MSTILKNIPSYNRMALALITHLALTHHGILPDLLKNNKKIVLFCADDWISSSVKPILGKNIIDGGKSWKATDLNPEN